MSFSKTKQKRYFRSLPKGNRYCSEPGLLFVKETVTGPDQLSFVDEKQQLIVKSEADYKILFASVQFEVLEEEFER